MTAKEKFPEIEKWLNEQGQNNGRPLYRLVWSDSEFEHRYGTFNDFSAGGLFLRQTTETRLTPKYSYIQERWVLEKFFDQHPTSELPSPNGYEPFWTFEGKDKRYQAPTLKVVQFIVELSRVEVRVSALDRSIQYRNLFDGKSEREIAEIEDELECSPMTNALHMREGVGYTKGLK